MKLVNGKFTLVDDYGNPINQATPEPLPPALAPQAQPPTLPAVAFFPPVSHQQRTNFVVPSSSQTLTNPTPSSTSSIVPPSAASSSHQHHYPQPMGFFNTTTTTSSMQRQQSTGSGGYPPPSHPDAATTEQPGNRTERIVFANMKFHEKPLEWIHGPADLMEYS